MFILVYSKLAKEGFVSVFVFVSCCMSSFIGLPVCSVFSWCAVHGFYSGHCVMSMQNSTPQASWRQSLQTRPQTFGHHLIQQGRGSKHTPRILFFPPFLCLSHLHCLFFPPFLFTSIVPSPPPHLGRPLLLF